MKNEKFHVSGMTCAACQANVTRAVQKLGGVDSVNVNLLSGRMDVKYNETETDEGAIMSAVEAIGYGVSPLNTSGNDKSTFRSQWNMRQERAENEQKAMKKRLVTSIVLLIPLMYIAMASMAGLPIFPFFKGMENSLIFAFAQFLLTVPIVFINRKFYISGFKALAKRAPNMDSLVAIGSAAALIYGIAAIFCMAYGLGHHNEELVHKYMHSLYFESAAMILTLVTVGKYLEAKSKAKTSDALGRLVNLAPKTASVIRNGNEITIPAEQVVRGDIVVIRPGDTLPVDGVITEGFGFLDQSAITGESIPVAKGVGENVISATANKNGTFKFKALNVGENTTLSKIIQLVDEAGSTKAPIARVADKVSGIFVPAVIVIALITMIIWLIAGKGPEFAVTNAISVLVISCPCALGLATPVAIMVGTGKAAEFGILVKNAESLENLHSVDIIVLDKTGTITSGHPAVTDIIPLNPNVSADEFLSEAAAVEIGSGHPLAQAVTERAQSENLMLPKVDNFSSVSGRGVTAQIGENQFAGGNAAFMRENGYESDENTELHIRRLANEGKTPLLFYKNGAPEGIIAVADTVRESSRAAVQEFKKLGIDVVMLTGDNKVTAEAIRTELGIEKVIADVMPADKEQCIRELQQNGHTVAMVGDGINDAPALSRADIGIAIGAGTDIAIDSADVILMKNSLYDVVTAVNLSQSVIRNIHMNLFWAFFYNCLGIPVAAGVFYSLWGLLLSPMLGAAAMSLSSVCVVLNALRLRFFKAKKKYEIKESVSDNPERKGENTMKKIIYVDGMMCAHCQAHVQNALSAVDGVSEVTVDLENKLASVTLLKDVSDKELADAVSQAGYTPVECKTV